MGAFVLLALTGSILTAAADPAPMSCVTEAGGSLGARLVGDPPLQRKLEGVWGGGFNSAFLRPADYLQGQRVDILPGGTPTARVAFVKDRLNRIFVRGDGLQAAARAGESPRLLEVVKICADDTRILIHLKPEWSLFGPGWDDRVEVIRRPGTAELTATVRRHFVNRPHEPRTLAIHKALVRDAPRVPAPAAPQIAVGGAPPTADR